MVRFDWKLTGTWFIHFMSAPDVTYNANAEEMMMQATVTDAAGVTRPAQPSLVRQIKGEGVTKLVFHYDPSGVAAGPARLDLIVHKKGSADLRKASLPLIVTN